MLSDKLLPIAFSVVLHGGLIALMAASWQPEKSVQRVVPPSYVKAKLVELKPKAKKATQKKAPNKVDLTKKQKQLAEQQQKARQAEQQRQAALKQKQAEEKRQQELELAKQQREKNRIAREEEQRRIETRQQFEQALKEEEAQLLEDSYATEAQSWKDVIARRIEQNWSRPQSARNGMRCEISLHLVPNGHVVNATITKGSGNAAFDRSALSAVRKAEPFPEIKEIPSEVFERYFRKFTLAFSPLDRRL